PIGICTSLTVTFSVTGLPLASLIGLPFSSILGLSWLVDWISGTVLYSLKFWITPWETSRVAAMMEMGSRMDRVQRVMSTQKLPSIEHGRRTKPRVTAMAIAMPVAAETKLCTARPTIWVK